MAWATFWYFPWVGTAGTIENDLQTVSPCQAAQQLLTSPSAHNTTQTNNHQHTTLVIESDKPGSSVLNVRMNINNSTSYKFQPTNASEMLNHKKTTSSFEQQAEDTLAPIPTEYINFEGVRGFCSTSDNQRVFEYDHNTNGTVRAAASKKSQVRLYWHPPTCYCKIHK